jgi:hypothetical protein
MVSLPGISALVFAPAPALLPIQAHQFFRKAEQLHLNRIEAMIAFQPDSLSVAIQDAYSGHYRLSLSNRPSGFPDSRT